MCAQPGGSTELKVVTSGKVSVDDIERARTVLLEEVGRTAHPVSSTVVTLSVVADPELPRPALVEVTSDLGGRKVRAHAAAPSLREAIDLVRGRFALRLPARRAG